MRLKRPAGLSGGTDNELLAGAARMRFAHALGAMRVIVARDALKFVGQKARLLSALVRPALWLMVFAVGFQDIFGVSITPPYQTYITYQEYVLPGLIGIVLLFNGMLSSLALVYDREMGVMRLILTAPLPRWYLLVCKLLAGALLSVLQAYAFLAVAALVGVRVPWSGWLTALPAIVAGAVLMGAMGLALSVYIRQLENFAGAMNFVIFPMFFLSSALYPLWKLRENGGPLLYGAAASNPFTHAIELIRFALYGEFHAASAVVVGACALVFFGVAAFGYEPPRTAAPRGELANARAA
jgi:ABC-2 type transport system permease protein